MRIVDQNSWNRREYFDFFSTFDEPYFGIVSEVDCTGAYGYCKENKLSFFAWYLHRSAMAIHEIPEFSYRVDGKDVVVFNEIHASPTIGREDGTFGFGFVPFERDFVLFSNSLTAEIARVRDSQGIGLNEKTMRLDVIHYSSIPWFRFTGLTHARNYKTVDGIPKISFGRAVETGQGLTMQVAVNGHHGLLDGLHVARYLDLFQGLLNGD
jgi:chloramphenicol O-acetyltransferase type A